MNTYRKYLKFLPLLLALSACGNNNTTQNTTTQNTIIYENQSTQPTEIASQQSTQEVTTQPATEVVTEPTTEKVVIDYNVVKPNEVGDIPIIMYHAVVEGTPPSVYQRNVDDFKKDLQYLYDNNYRLLSMEDYVNNNITIEAGCTPVILTFDDGLSESFSLIEENGVLKPTPNCAVDIINEFVAEHPDFGKAAVFHMNGDNDPFSGAGTLKERLEYLIDNGYEIGSHLYSHIKLKEKNGEEIQMYIGKLEQMVHEVLPEYQFLSLAYPYGIRPVDEFKPLVASGSYENVPYTYAVALREGNSGASSAPNNVKYDPYNLPRLRGSEGEEGDLWWYFKNYYEQYPLMRYISDGDPDTIVVPASREDRVNKDSLNGKELIIY